ncbi:testis-expressed protein 19 [Perognathus longimembris pacificus]|uniref:testis-expressed protein 19 n=1 Tax=Perognathus longimembris pacificus TaxID=214514 RepID=UPI002019DB8D|nr:testis-expressed protein 19 [Perognathus longimembris pacificus]
MCPPVIERHGREGMSHLFALWAFRLLHGEPLRMCFACFKIAFLDLKNLLESEEWEDDDWDLDPLESPDEEEEEFAQVHPGALAPVAIGLQQVSLGYSYVPTELRPEDVVPLDAGPKDADWIQGLPWRSMELPSCSHWPQAPLSWQWSLSVDHPPREPMVLELGTIWPVEPMEAEAWLLGLQFVTMESHGDAFYLRKMVPDSLLQPLSYCWKLLLYPDEACKVGLQDLPQYLDLPRWKLSILDSTMLHTQLVPADTMLLKKGFRIMSCSPQSKGEAEWGGSAPEVEDGLSLPESWSWGPEWPSWPEWPLWPSWPESTLGGVGYMTFEELPFFQPLLLWPQHNEPEFQAATLDMAVPEHQEPERTSSPPLFAVDQLAPDDDLDGWWQSMGQF